MREFEYPQPKRWYAELVLHGYLEYEDFHACEEYTFCDEDEILSYHQALGCYLKVFRNEYKYLKSPEGKVDQLRDDILELHLETKNYRRLYSIGRYKENHEIMQYAISNAESIKSIIAIKQMEIMKVMTGKL